MFFVPPFCTHKSVAPQKRWGFAKHRSIPPCPSIRLRSPPVPLLPLFINVLLWLVIFVQSEPSGIHWNLELKSKKQTCRGRRSDNSTDGQCLPLSRGNPGVPGGSRRQAMMKGVAVLWIANPQAGFSAPFLTAQKGGNEKRRKSKSASARKKHKKTREPKPPG